jgi:protein-tyrosine phosphatase
MMIDIHCHILPGIDDGAQSVAESLEMAKAAVKEGIHTIIATPHHKNNRYENPKFSIITRVNELNEVLEKESIPIKIFPGQEVRIYGEILEDLHSGEILSLNETQYLFIEFPTGHVPRYAEKLLFDLQLKGITPIIVHPERNRELLERPELLYDLVKKGSLTQVTASSICGYFGKKVRDFSFQLIEANLTHFVASDAHNTHNRAFKVAESIDVIETKYGYDMVSFFTENAELLIKDQNIYKEAPEQIKKKKFLGIF